jgi:hypothetical protein
VFNLEWKEEVQQANVLVKYCFAMWPDTKSSDKLLYLQVWDLQGLKLTPQQRDIFLHDVLSPETIGRVRRQIQEEARERLDPSKLPRPEVLKKRLGKQADLRKFYGNK